MAVPKGAPRKGEERSQEEIEEELRLWELQRKRKRRSLPSLHREGTNPFVGRTLSGESWYRASCGHVVRNQRTKLCRRCWFVDQDKNAARSVLGGYKSVPYARRYENRKPVFEHREIAEATLGRKLKDGEIVHHINMDKTDNRRCNLLICTKNYHRLLHYRMQLYCATRIRAQQGV